MHICVRRKDGMRQWHGHRNTAKHDVSVGGKCWPFTPGGGKHARAQSCDMRHDQWWEPDQRSVQVPEDVDVGGVGERISEGNFSRVRRMAPDGASKVSPQVLILPSLCSASERSGFWPEAKFYFGLALLNHCKTKLKMSFPK